MDTGARGDSNSSRCSVSPPGSRMVERSCWWRLDADKLSLDLSRLRNFLVVVPTAGTPLCSRKSLFTQLCAAAAVNSAGIDNHRQICRRELLRKLGCSDAGFIDDAVEPVFQSCVFFRFPARGLFMDDG
jgi:hypothetical protein